MSASDESVSLQRVRLGEGLAINCAMAGAGEPVLLLHGWPQTHHAWRHVVPRMASSYRVIAPDLPGFGNSSKPQSGYDKKTVAKALRELMQVLGHDEFHVVGHDLGGQVAYPIAAQWPDIVKSLTFIEAGIPGLGDKDDAANPWRGGSWHFGFNMLHDLPEMLVAGREREYLHFLFHRDTIGLFAGDAITGADLDIYTEALAQPGGLRGSFSHYRAMLQDRDDNRAFAAAGRLELPVLVIGAQYGVGLGWVDTVEAAANRVETALVEQSGHYLPEERPADVAALLHKFISGIQGRRGDNS